MIRQTHQFGIMNMTFVFFFSMLIYFSVPVKAQPSTDCDLYHHCLTCIGVHYNCSSCNKGYFLKEFGDFYTCARCLKVCSECENALSCTACKISNHYGKECRGVCSEGCLNATCNHSGTCLCKDNYEGGRCDLCAKGKYGQECAMQCPPHCVTCISNTNCTECKSGYYGNDCRSSCSQNCASCSSGTSCDKCKDGFYTNDCRIPCAPHCFTCTSNSHCTGCKGIYNEGDCMSICSPNCATCSSETSCDRCKIGFWGDKCKNKCPRGCFKDICTKKTGVCQDKRCKSGFVGETCDRCLPGKYGVNCDMTTEASRKGSSASALQFRMCLLVAAVLLCFVDVTGSIYGTI